MAEYSDSARRIAEAVLGGDYGKLPPASAQYGGKVSQFFLDTWNNKSFRVGAVAVLAGAATAGAYFIYKRYAEKKAQTLA